MNFDIGQITNTQGIKGEVKAIPLTDDPNRFKKLEWVYLSTPDHKSLDKYFIEGVRLHKNFVLLKFKGIDTMSDAEKLKGKVLVIPREMAVKLPKHTYFIADIVGLEVETVEGQALGTISKVIHTGSNDVYIIKGKGGKDILIPALKDIIKNIDFEEKKMIVKLIEGLI
jgi:16S rRNA processing protein RimM